MSLPVLEKTNSLNEIFHNNPEHVNNEYVHKAIFKEDIVYISPDCSWNPEIMKFLEQHLVTIVVPNSIRKIQDIVQEETTQVLQSCYENGRVLQASKKLILDGVEYEVLLKWVWATKYARETGAINPWMKWDGYKYEDHEKQALKDFWFHEYRWIYSKQDAIDELERSEMLLDIWVDCEKVLAIYEFDEIIWQDGEYISVQELENKGVIVWWEEPVILVRAHKTNFRLLDITMLDKYQRTESIPNLIDHIVSESQKHWWTNNLDEYLQKLFSTVIKNRLKLSWKFSRLNGEKWQDISRNISMFWEELDLGTMDPMEDNFYTTNPHYYIGHYEDNLRSIFVWFSHLIKALDQNVDYKIDHQELANTIYQVIVDWISENKECIREVASENNWNKWSFTANPDHFIIELFKKCFSSFTNYSNRCEYEKILRERIIEKGLN